MLWIYKKVTIIIFFYTIIIFLLIISPRALFSAETSDSLNITFHAEDDPGANGKIYAGYRMYVEVQGCSENYIIVKSDDEFHGYVSVDENGSVRPIETFKKPGTHTVKAECCRDIRSGDDGAECSNGRVYKSGEADIEVLDTATIQPDDTEGNSCEVCHPDWPGYDGSQTDPALRCRGAKTPDEENWKYTLKPIRVDTCGKGYVCIDHTVGCTVPEAGLKPPAQPCTEGKDESGEITTDKEKIITCTKFSTGLSEISVDPAGFVSSLLGIFLSISGMIALYLIIRSGYQLMMSRGNPEAIQEAKERLTSAIVGLLLIIFSLVIMSIIGVNILKIPGFS